MALDFPDPKDLRRKLADLAHEMSAAAAGGDNAIMKKLAREHAALQSLLELVERFEKISSQLAEAAALANDAADLDLAALAREDVARLTLESANMAREISDALTVRDPRDRRDVILEIRSGAGGEEAALFAAELFRAYSNYGRSRGWHIHIVNSAPSEQGGFKEVVAEISCPSTSSGQGAFGTLKFERGVHRVQRVPATEKQGRIHTSTVTVAVLPQAEEIDIDIRPEDLRIDTYRASGAGGQHVNKTSSAVRITHLPTNTVVAVQDERSQHKNKEKAFKILRSRLLEAQEEAQHKKQASERRTQVGTGDRSEKIRTYNFHQDRITDHRIRQSWSNIEGVLQGQLEPIFEALRAVESKLLLQSSRS